MVNMSYNTSAKSYIIGYNKREQICNKNGSYIIYSRLIT